MLKKIKLVLTQRHSENLNQAVWNSGCPHRADRWLIQETRGPLIFMTATRYYSADVSIFTVSSVVVAHKVD